MAEGGVSPDEMATVDQIMLLMAVAMDNVTAPGPANRDRLNSVADMLTRDGRGAEPMAILALTLAYAHVASGWGPDDLWAMRDSLPRLDD